MANRRGFLSWTSQNPDWDAASKALHLPAKLIKKYIRRDKTRAAVEAARRRNMSQSTEEKNMQESTAYPSPTVEQKTGEIEQMCAEICDVRQQAEKIRVMAEEIGLRILGPVPPGEPRSAASPNLPCLTGIVGEMTTEIRDNLREASGSLDRIYRELGSIGKG